MIQLRMQHCQNKNFEIICLGNWNLLPRPLENFIYISKAQIYFFETIGEVMDVFESLLAALCGVTFARRVHACDMWRTFPKPIWHCTAYQRISAKWNYETVNSTFWKQSLTFRSEAKHGKMSRKKEILRIVERWFTDSKIVGVKCKVAVKHCSKASYFSIPLLNFFAACATLKLFVTFGVREWTAQPFLKFNSEIGKFDCGGV